MMQGATYEQRRFQLETYFDRTAVAAWAALTSTTPVGRIRATVRAGRDAMRETLLSWLPADMTGLRLLDAGCGTGALALAAAERGAKVVAIDLSPQLIDLARRRAAKNPAAGRVTFAAGDMLDPAHGSFDYVVLMDSIIHYQTADTLQALARLAARTKTALLFTFAPRTPVLGTMLALGRLFPRGNRSPAIEPQNAAKLRAALAKLPGAACGRTAKISSGFYISQAQELVTWK